jgi:DNA-binding HxlR family transcriptional regulator
MAAKKTHSSCLDTLNPVRDSLDVISGKWKLPIIISISGGNERFTDIQASIPGITPKVLAKELKELEQNKLIKRIVTDDYPVKIAYKPEPYADTLAPIIYALKDWGLTHSKKVLARDDL